VVLNVRLLVVDVVEAVGGASVEATHDFEVTGLIGLVSDVDKEVKEWVVVPIDFMICADLVGRIWTSCRVMGGKSALKTDWNEM
jgi:hypothetical protein